MNSSAFDTDNEEQEEMEELPTPQEFFVEIPLYRSFVIEGLAQEEVTNLVFPVDSIDCYCEECNNESVFRPQYKPGPRFGLSEDFKGIIQVTFHCARNESHLLRFVVFASGYIIEKIGQLPSQADLVRGDIEKYRSVLRQRFSEFTRAIGLAAHGVGIGSFVYLRRILEDLIERAHKEASHDAGWDEPKYQRSRVVERIGLLHFHLPSFLVNNASLYGIVSKGIHELSESECLAHFSLMRSSIELILDERLAQRERSQKEKEAAKLLSNIAGKLKRGEGA
jgi:hypothetical protein